MEGWPSINALRDWAPHPCPFTRPGREGCCQKSRRWAIDPATFPSCGWQLQCQWAWGCHAAPPRRKDSQQLHLCGGGREKSLMICLWMSDPSKQPLKTYDGLHQCRKNLHNKGILASVYRLEVLHVFVSALFSEQKLSRAVSRSFHYSHMDILKDGTEPMSYKDEIVRSYDP